MAVEQNNLQIFLAYQQKYPQLLSIYFIDHTLYFSDTLKIDTSSFSLKEIPESIFKLSPLHLYTYLSNHFYRQDPTIDAESILQLFLEPVITPKEEILIQKFTYDFWLRLKLYYEEPLLTEEENFMKELYKKQQVITESFRSDSAAASQIRKIYNDLVYKETIVLNEDQNSTNQGKSNGKGLALTRTKAGDPSWKELENDDLGLAGFASTIIILVSTVAIGIYLAMKFMP